MIWPLRKKIPEQRHSEAEAAIDRANEAVEQLREQEGEVHKIAEFLRERRKDNHFGEGLMRILRGDEPK